MAGSLMILKPIGLSSLPSDFPITPALSEGTHYYAFSPNISTTTYSKARATITLPMQINFGTGSRKRNAYITRGMVSLVTGKSFGMGISNKGGAGWKLCFNGTILNDTVEGAALPSGTAIVDLVIEAQISGGKSKMVMTATCKNAQGTTISTLAPYTRTLSKKYFWDRYYRSVSLTCSEIRVPTDKGVMMMGVKLSNLGLYNGFSYKDWGIYTNLIEEAWIVDYPYGSFSANSITATSEVFNCRQQLR